MPIETPTNGTAHIESIATDVVDTVKRGPGRPKGSKNKNTNSNSVTRSTPRTKRSLLNRFINNKEVRKFLLLPREIQDSIRNIVSFGDSPIPDEDLDLSEDGV